MEGISVFVSLSLLSGIIFRIIDRRDRSRSGRLGPGTPARFLYFTGRRLGAARRVHAYSSEE